MKKAIELFKDIKNIYNIDLIKNNFELAKTLDAEIELGKWHFPNIAKDYEKELSVGQTLDDVLKELPLKELKKKNRRRKNTCCKRKTFYELDIIKTKGYTPYFWWYMTC